MRMTKVFLCVQLPAEVRDRIYEVAIGPVIKPYPTHHSRNLRPRKSLIEDRLPNANLLYTNKQVYTEASAVIARYTTFLVETLDIGHSLVENKAQAARIRHLSLNISIDKYFVMFKSAEFFVGVDSSYSALDLRDMNLKSIEINIPSPQPCGSVSGFDSMCHKVVLDCLLPLIWLNFKGQSLTINGYILPTLKAKFEAQCDKERAKFLEWKSFIEVERPPEANLANKSTRQQAISKRTRTPRLTQKKMGQGEERSSTSRKVHQRYREQGTRVHWSAHSENVLRKFTEELRGVPGAGRLRGN